jgi:arginase
VKSGALPLIFSGDCVSVLAAIAGTRRYFRNVSLIYMDRDADLNVPATTASGCIDGMVISQVIGRGAPELVRFWGEPPLVREPDVALFGFDRVDPPEEQYLLAAPLRRHPYLEVVTAGADAAARTALERVHAAKHEFVLHFDVDLINGEEFPWTNFPGPGGLSLSQVRDALGVFVSQPNLAAFEVAGYNPELDPEGQGAKTLIELLVAVLSKRMEVLAGSTGETAQAANSAAAGAAAATAGARQPGNSDPISEPAVAEFSGSPEPEAHNS